MDIDGKMERDEKERRKKEKKREKKKRAKQTMEMGNLEAIWAANTHSCTVINSINTNVTSSRDEPFPSWACVFTVDEASSSQFDSRYADGAISASIEIPQTIEASSAFKQKETFTDIHHHKVGMQRLGSAAQKLGTEVAAALVHPTNATAASKLILSAVAISKTADDFAIIWDCPIEDTAARSLILDGGAAREDIVDVAAPHELNVDTAAPLESAANQKLAAKNAAALCPVADQRRPIADAVAREIVTNAVMASKGHISIPLGSGNTAAIAAPSSQELGAAGMEKMDAAVTVAAQTQNSAAVYLEQEDTAAALMEKGNPAVPVLVEKEKVAATAIIGKENAAISALKVNNRNMEFAPDVGPTLDGVREEDNTTTLTNCTNLCDQIAAVKSLNTAFPSTSDASMSNVQQHGSFMRGKNSTSNDLEGKLVVGLPAQNICKRDKEVHGKKKSAHHVVKFHPLNLDPNDLVDVEDELNCARGRDIDDLDKMSKLAQERGNSIQNLDNAIVDDLNFHGVANDVEIDCAQERDVDKSCNTINMVNACGETSLNEAEDNLEHVFGELREIPSNAVSPLREALNLDFVQDELAMRSIPRKFRQSMFAGRPLVGGTLSSKVRVNMSRITGPSTIVSSGLP
ncbi:hypothetical protein ACH5RR_008735 [Cinchona calisaya]|uniref:Uncharacterized protein n=1 Tax=Cinchona calisaya TaxID=153742 RepID=A0ABD3AHN8_9GENT